jgi:hypothetical protein
LLNLAVKDIKLAVKDRIGFLLMSGGSIPSPNSSTM